MRAETQILNAAEAPSPTPILEMRGISQIFPGVKALDSVDIALYPGKVTALIGENGAGKSTLVKILTGIYRPNEGDILLDGQPVNFHSAQDAIDAGVTAIHQETVLFDELSVGENIFLGHAPKGRLGLIDDPKEPVDVRQFKRKALSIHWETMFARPVFQTADMIEQHKLLTQVAELIDAGKIKTTLSDVLGPINATNLKAAHALIESGKTRGKLVLSGF